MININRIKESQTGTDTLIECQEEGKGQSQREYDTQRITNNCKKKPVNLKLTVWKQNSGAILGNRIIIPCYFWEKET